MFEIEMATSPTAAGIILRFLSLKDMWGTPEAWTAE